MQITQISNVCGSRPSFFVLGPVKKKAGKCEKMLTHIPEEGMDATSKWPSVGMVKLKFPPFEIEKTTWTLVYVGSENSRRSLVAVKKRRTDETKRRG